MTQSQGEKESKVNEVKVKNAKEKKKKPNQCQGKKESKVSEVKVKEGKVGKKNAEKVKEQKVKVKEGKVGKKNAEKVKEQKVKKEVTEQKIQRILKEVNNVKKKIKADNDQMDQVMKVKVNCRFCDSPVMRSQVEEHFKSYHKMTSKKAKLCKFREFKNKTFWGIGVRLIKIY